MNFDRRWKLLITVLLLLLGGGCNDKLDVYHETVAASELGIRAVSLTPESIVLSRGETRQMAFTATLANGEDYPLNDKAKWDTGDAAIASVDTNGLVTANSDGSTWVRARFAQFNALRTILVNTADLVTLDLNGSDSVSVCRPADYTLNGHYDDGSERPVDASTAAWSLEPATAGTVDNKGRLTITSATATSVTLSATKSGISADKSVTVVHDLAQVVPSAAALTVEIGSSIKPAATATYQDGSETDLGGIAQWVSTLPAIATVDHAGLIEGVAVGTTTVRVSCGGISSDMTVTVVPSAEVSALEIENGEAEIKAEKGSTLELEVSAIYTTGRRSIVTSDADWSAEVITGGPITVSNDDGSKGEVDTSNTGEAFIKATFQNQSDWIKVIIE